MEKIGNPAEYTELEHTVARELAGGESQKAIAGALAETDTSRTLAGWVAWVNRLSMRIARDNLICDAARGVIEPGSAAPATVPPAEPTLEQLQRESEALVQSADAFAASTAVRMRGMLETILEVGERALKRGDMTLGQRAMRDAAKLSNDLLRHERALNEGSDAIVVSKDEVARARTKMQTYFKALAARPLLCAKCDCELSVLWGTGTEGDGERS